MFDSNLKSSLFFTIYLCTKWMAQSAPVAPVVCPTGWFGHDWSGMCYKAYHDRHLRWSSARRVCQKDRGDLAVTRVDKVQDFINERLSLSRTYWIGLEYKKNKWIDDEAAWLPSTGGGGELTYGYILFDDDNEAISWQPGLTSDARPFVCQTAPLRSVGVCPRQWTVHTDNMGHQTCFKVYGDDLKSWKEAKNMCQKDEAHLVTIESEATDEFIKGLISGPAVYWVDNMDPDSKYPVITWDSGEPSRFPGEECIMMINNKHKGFKLHDNVCDVTYPYICEKKLMGCPEGWHLFQDKTCFKVFYKSEDLRNKNQAEKFCNINGGHLAKIPDKETDDFLKDILVGLLQFWIQKSTYGSLYPNGTKMCSIALLTLDAVKEIPEDCNNRHHFICIEDDFFSWDLSDGHTVKTWQEAQDACGSSGIFPFDIRLANVFGRPFYLFRIFIGLTKVGNYLKWTDGSLHKQGSYLGWRQGQPNNQKAFCAVLSSRSYQLGWDDVSCEQHNRFICQIHASPKEVCPDAWESSHRKCYKFYRDDHRDWKNADLQCRQDNGQLLTVDDKESNRYVIDHISAGPERLWIGARDKNNTNTYVWDHDDKPLTYLGWGPQEPQNGPLENCATIFHNKEFNTGYLWDDITCEQSIPYICQKDVVYPPGAFTCPEGYTVYEEGQACFKAMHNLKMSWENARNYCQADGGDLAVFPDWATDDFVASLLIKGMRYWFGLRRPGPQQDFEWVNGDRVHKWSLSNDRWIEGEPNDPVNQLCIGYQPLSTKAHQYHLWKDMTCAKIRSFICEREGHLALFDLKEVEINGQSYFIPFEELQNRDIEESCKSHNLTQLFIQSNDHFKHIQAWVSNALFLEGDDIWIKTDKPLFWDFNVWNNNEFISPDAWVSDIQDWTCPEDEECCVVLTNDTNRDGHYLVNAKCSGTALYVCVKENNVTTSTIPPPKLESNNSKSMGKLRELMDSNNKSQTNKCPCRCGMNFDPNPTPEVLEQLKAQIVKKLLVNVNNLSSTVSKKMSAKDSRPSSKTIGFGSIVMIFIPLCIIIAFDLTRFWKKEDE